MGNVKQVRVGPGVLYVAAVGSTEPTNLSAAWDVAWTPLGYTEEGHTFTYTPSFEGVEVAEEFTPVMYLNTQSEYRVQFACAEITAANIKRALNGGTITTATNITTFEPPLATDVPLRVALGWQADDAKERWVFRKCVQTGASEIARRKAPDKSTIPMEFLLELPSSGKPFKAIIDETP